MKCRACIAPKESQFYEIKGIVLTHLRHSELVLAAPSFGVQDLVGRRTTSQDSVDDHRWTEVRVALGEVREADIGTHIPQKLDDEQL